MDRMRKMLRTDDVMARVRRDITEGTYQPGDPLPDPEDLAAELGVISRAVESAYRKLAEDGTLMESLLTPGFVVADAEHDPTVRSLVRAVAAMQRHLEQLDGRLSDLADRVDTVSRSLREAHHEAERARKYRL